MSVGIPSSSFWITIFGNDRPVAIEIGPGRGEFLVAAAQSNSRWNYYAIERSHSQTRAIQQKLSTLGLANARVIHADAGCAIGLVPDACVAAYYIQFPDPWWKRRHHRRRLWTPTFVAELRRTLTPGGTIELVTDVPDYFAQAQGFLNSDPGLEVVSTGPASGPSTSFARKACMRGAATYASIHRRRVNPG